MGKHIVVIGGGLAGTSAAHRLVKYGYEVTVIEQGSRLGGRISSKLVDGVAVEMGAGFMTDSYKNLRAFLAENDLEPHLSTQRSSTDIFKNGKIQTVNLRTLLGNTPISWRAKAHILPLFFRTLTRWNHLDLQAFWKADRYDKRSVADMFSSVSGKEFLEYALQPTLRGYFYWTPEQTSESMLFLLNRAAFSRRTYKMATGLQRIPEKAASGSKVLLNHSVEKVQQRKDGSYVVTAEHESSSTSIAADGVVCATAATIVPVIIPDLSRRQKNFFEIIQYSSGALVADTYKSKQATEDRVIAFPRQEGVDLASVTVSGQLSDQGSPLVTVKTYASEDTAQRLVGMPENELAKVLSDSAKPVRSSIPVGGSNPVATNIQKWPEALPLFDVGHFKRLHAFEDGKIEDQDRPLVFAGDYLGGPFMEGAFTSGMEAAERLHARLQ